MSKVSIETKLSTLKHKPDGTPHISADLRVCKECQERTCTYICPAGVWNIDEKGECIIEYENCLECGACRIACPQSVVEWKYPKGGHGVVYKQS